MLVRVSRQNTVARLRTDESVRANETSHGTSDSCSRHLTPWKPLSCGWYYPARHSFCSASWTVSRFQHSFPRPPFSSWQVPFSGYWLWPLPICRLAWVRKPLWGCLNRARRPPCSSMLHHREIYMEHTYNNVPLHICTQLRDEIWDAEWGFRLVETGLQLQAGTRSFPSSPFQSIEKCPHMTYFLVWGCGKQPWITRLHCTCPAVCTSSRSGNSTSGGGVACRSGLYGGDRASGDHSRATDLVKTDCILSDHGATRVHHRLPCCWHHWALNIGCDPASGVACQERHNLQVRSLGTNHRHAARYHVVTYTLGNLQAMLPRLFCNAWSCHPHRDHCNTCSRYCKYV